MLNSLLASAVAKAKANGVPKANIVSALERVSYFTHARCILTQTSQRRRRTKIQALTKNVPLALWSGGKLD